jgi:DNA-damage-inducible protein J
MAAASPVRDRFYQVRTKASEVLAEKGLTIDDATYILLSKIADEGVVPDLLLTPTDEYDAWVKAMVQEALDDPGPDIPGEEVEAEFAERRAQLLARIERGER